MDELREPLPPEAYPPISLDEAIATMQMWAITEKERGLGMVTMSVSDAYRILCLAIERERARTRLPVFSTPPSSWPTTSAGKQK